MDVGVVIGRFQVDDLTEGHMYLINNALSNHRRVVVMLGVDPNLGTRQNPMDYPTRERMVRAKFPDVTCVPLPDNRSDEVWSLEIDGLLQTLVPNISSATLYGGRDSFVPHYHGKWNAVEVDNGLNYVNGSKKREDLGKVILASSDWRKGIIHATQNTSARVQPVTLVMCTHRSQRSVLLKHHATEDEWSFPGGTFGPVLESYEHAAKHYLSQWSNISAEGSPRYLSSGKISLWNFKSSHEIQVLATLMQVEYSFGSLKTIQGFDVKWVPITHAKQFLVEDQRKLLEAIDLEEFFQKEE